jgi:hypothetical protein
MSNSKLDRQKELDKIWFRLHTPKVGDKVKFRIRGKDEIHEGEVIDVKRDGGRYKFQMVSKTAPTTGTQDIEIVEANGIRFQKTDDAKQNDFKPI